MNSLDLSVAINMNCWLTIVCRLVFKRARVDQIGGLKIEIYSNEHAPPRFYVKSDEIDATFSISDCKLNGLPSTNISANLSARAGLGCRLQRERDRLSVRSEDRFFPAEDDRFDREQQLID